VRTDDAPNYPQSDEEAELRAELLGLQARLNELALSYAEGEIDRDRLLAATTQIRPRVTAIESELGMALSFRAGA
jgi:hypothetical protein